MLANSYADAATAASSLERAAAGVADPKKGVDTPTGSIHARVSIAALIIMGTTS